MSRLLKHLAFALVVAAVLPAVASADTVPLNHYVLPTKGSHVYRTTGAPTGYVTKPILALIDTTGDPGRELYRLKSASRPYEVTVTAEQRPAWIAKGYLPSADTLIGYRKADGADFTQTTWQLLSPTGEFLLTGDPTERGEKLASGWTEEGSFGGLTYRKCAPYPPRQTNALPKWGRDGKLAFDAGDPDPWAATRTIWANPCTSELGIQQTTADRTTGDWAFRNRLTGYETGLGGTLKGDRAESTVYASSIIGDTTENPGVLAAPNFEGLTRYFAFDFKLTDEFRIGSEVNTGNMIWEWHNGPAEDEAGYSPCGVPMMLFVKNYPNGPGSAPEVWWRQQGGAPVSGAGTGVGTGCTIYSNNQRLTLCTVEECRGKWQHMVVKITFQYDGVTPGEVQMWRNGVLVWENTGPNMYRDRSLVNHWGNYRQIKAPGLTSEILHDGWKMGNSYAEVAPG